MLLGMVDDVIKINKWSLGQSGGVAGPETCKIAIFEAIKKRKNRFKIGWNHKENVQGYLPNDFSAIRGHPLGGLHP